MNGAAFQRASLFMRLPSGYGMLGVLLLLAAFFFGLNFDGGHPDQPGEKSWREHHDKTKRNL